MKIRVVPTERREPGQEVLNAFGEDIRQLKSPDLRCNLEELGSSSLYRRSSSRILEERAIAEGKAEGRAVGREEGRIEACENVALGLIRLGKIALSDIASVCNLSLEKVQQLADTVKP